MTYHDLPDGVVAFSTTRHGGVSQGNYSEFNINPYCGDEPDAVKRNLALLANILFVPAKHIVLGTVPKLLYVPKQGQAIKPKDIAVFLKGRIENYKIPLLYEAVDAIKRTYNGKLDRKAYQ